MTQAQKRSFDNFRAWWQSNENPKPCRFCAYRHEGPHDYQNHLEEAHPDKYIEWKEWAGLR